MLAVMPRRDVPISFKEEIIHEAKKDGTFSYLGALNDYQPH